MIVVDASALLEVLLRRPAAHAIERRLFAGGQRLFAPHVIDLEVAQVLRRFEAARELPPRRGDEAILDLVDFPLHRYRTIVLLERIWQLRGSLTAYDAAYVALAEALEAPLITRDARLARAAGHRAAVHVV
ncbi:MAG: type II toxin-antitoxin system VapC family toxin [Candidatus Binatia bacterium]